MRLSLPQSAYSSARRGLWPRWPEIAIASLSINLLALALPLLTLQIYDRVMTSGHASTLNFLAGGVIVAIAMEIILRVCRSYVMGWAGAVFEHAVATSAVREVLTGDVHAIETDGIGEYVQRISAISRMRDFYSGQALQTWVDLPFALLFLGLIAFIGHSLVIVPLFLLAVMSTFAWQLGRQLRGSLTHRDKVDEGRYSFLIRVLSGIHTVKALGLEQQFERDHETQQFRSSRANYDVARLSALAYDEGVLFANGMMIAVAVAGGPMVLRGSLTLGALIACVLLAGRIMQPVQRAMGFWTRWQELTLAHDKLHALFRTAGKRSVQTGPVPEREGRVELLNVSFAYPNQPKILDNVTLQLQRGDAISISGPTGSGKKTFGHLLMGVYQPNEGEVLIDGALPQAYSSDELVEHIGYLPQEGVILRGTIQENLSRFGRVPQDRVQEMCRLLGIAEDVAILPEGYDTRLEGGHVDNIPPGLRQRIAIARAIALKPRVLLFHNADRALDRTGYNLIYSLLGQLKGRVTLVIITEDKNILKLADTHYRLDNGRLVEQNLGDARAIRIPANFGEVRQ